MTEFYEPRFVCADCSRDIDPELERCFAITSEVVLCYECSVRRGGAYDELEDRWARAPVLSDVPVPKDLGA